MFFGQQRVVSAQRVYIHVGPMPNGRVAQLGEHRPYKPGVTGSSPVPPTIYQTTAGS